MRFAALVAAAGASTRMGSCKALLPYAVSTSGRIVTFVRRICEVYVVAGAGPVVVTLPDARDDEARVRADLAGLPLVLTHNSAPHEGLSGSVAAALTVAPDVDALLVSPVDCPFLDAGLVAALVASLRTGPAAVPVATAHIGGEGSASTRNPRGHPVAFARPTFELLWGAGTRGGPRGVLDALADDVIEVPWSDDRVVEDVDTPEDYERLLGRPLERVS